MCVGHKTGTGKFAGAGVGFENVDETVQVGRRDEVVAGVKARAEGGGVRGLGEVVVVSVVGVGGAEKGVDVGGVGCGEGDGHGCCGGYGERESVCVFVCVGR